MTFLHQIGNFLREKTDMIPLSLVRAVFVAIPVIILIWVLLLPKSETTPQEDRPIRWDENLKIGASIALVFQIMVYYFWG